MDLFWFILFGIFLTIWLCRVMPFTRFRFWVVISPGPSSGSPLLELRWQLHFCLVPGACFSLLFVWGPALCPAHWSVSSPFCSAHSAEFIRCVHRSLRIFHPEVSALFFVSCVLFGCGWSASPRLPILRLERRKDADCAGGGSLWGGSRVGRGRGREGAATAESAT